jgi:DNA-binding NtrC family response regulator
MKTVATTHPGTLETAASAGVQVVVVEGPDAGRAARVTRDTECVVGTEPGVGLVLRDDRVSRKHCTLRHVGGGIDVLDLGSTNGTFHEGTKIDRATVAVGATLKLGHTFVRLLAEPTALEVSPTDARRFGEMVGESLAMREVFAVLELAARSNVTVLLEGETGSGKELAARAIHDASDRRKKAFVAIDCSALPEGLVESELFGHVRGAFTGATGPRKGAFARADGGTLFLDELGSVPPNVQTRLLRVLEERRVRSVGSDEERAVDVRVVAASREDLAQKVAEGGFRPDLYYRLSVLRVCIPPLRARREDIAPIALEILRLRGLEGPVEGAGLDALHVHHWPGNARELRNTLDRAIALAPEARTFAELRIPTPGLAAAGNDDAFAVRSDLAFADAKQRIVSAFERRYLADLVERAGGNVSEAARMADVDRKHLRDLLDKYGLAPRR